MLIGPTWYRANHELLVSGISRVGFGVPGLKSVSGGDGSFCRFTGDGFLRVGLNGTCPRQWRSGNVMLSLHWLEGLLLSNGTVAYLFDRSALVHRGIVAQQIGNPKGDLVNGAEIQKIYSIFKHRINALTSTTYLSIVLYMVLETFSGDIPPAFCHNLLLKMLSGLLPEKYLEPWEPCNRSNQYAK